MMKLMAAVILSGMTLAEKTEVTYFTIVNSTDTTVHVDVGDAFGWEDGTIGPGQRLTFTTTHNGTVDVQGKGYDANGTLVLIWERTSYNVKGTRTFTLTLHR
jgi:hypothetical protein